MFVGSLGLEMRSEDLPTSLARHVEGFYAEQTCGLMTALARLTPPYVTELQDRRSPKEMYIPRPLGHMQPASDSCGIPCLKRFNFTCGGYRGLRDFPNLNCNQADGCPRVTTSNPSSLRTPTCVCQCRFATAVSSMKVFSGL